MKNHNEDLAKSAIEILNDLMGEIHGARIIGVLALKKPTIIPTKHPMYIVRNSISIIVLSLRKFDDLWTRQLVPTLLAAELPQDGIQLHQDIEKKKLRTFCNRIVAHYAEEKTDLKTPVTKIEELLIEQGFTTDMDFLLWTKDMITKIELVRDCIAVRYNLNSNLNIH